MNNPRAPGRSILIVDDDAAVRTVMRSILEEAGHSIEEAQNGREALDVISRGGIDLIITDLVMPEQEGLETIKRLSKEYPAVKVIAMSGAFGGDYLQIAGFMGAHKTLTKPVRVQTVLDAVESIFAGGPDGRDPAE